MYIVWMVSVLKYRSWQQLFNVYMSIQSICLNELATCIDDNSFASVVIMLKYHFTDDSYDSMF